MTGHLLFRDGSSSELDSRLAYQLEADQFEVTRSDYWLSGYQGPGVDSYKTSEGSAWWIGNPRLTNFEDSFGADLLRRYQLEGRAVLSDLEGHFAIVLRDEVNGRTLAVTDRVGSFPLFYTAEEGSHIVASSLENLVSIQEITAEFDDQAVYDYFFFHVIPGPSTVFSFIHRLDPGHCLEIAEGVNVTSSYWKPRYRNESARRARSGSSEKFRRLLRESVSSSIDNSLNPGCFLSGGIDSSTVSGLVKELTGRARTYSIGFDAEGYDEMEYARLAARHFGTDHHEYYVTADDVIEAIPLIAEGYGQPFGNSSAVPTYFCARLAARDGVDLLLGGDGGDELFGGNLRYSKQMLLAHYDRVPEFVRRHVLEPFSRLQLAQRGPVYKLQRYIEQASAPVPERLEAYNYLQTIGTSEIFHADFLQRVNVQSPHEQQKRVFDETEARTLLNKLLALDYRFTLADNDLPKVSIMCATAGLPVAFPLLDDRLVEFAAALPPREKVRGSRLRAFMKDSLQGFLPDATLSKSKQGFGLPFGPWLQNHSRLMEMVRELMDGLSQRGVVRAEFISDLMNRKLSEHPHYYGGFIWVLMMFEQSLRHHEARHVNEWSRAAADASSGMPDSFS